MTAIFHNHFTLTGPLMKDLLELTKELMRFKSMHSRPDEI
jgi:hypothetical protein